MMKSFITMPKFSGNFTDDLEEVIEEFETVSDIFDVSTDQEKLKEVPIMLKSTTFRKYSQKKKRFRLYEEGIDELRMWFSSTERQTRLLSEWNSMRLTDAMEQNPKKSEMETFKAFVDRATELQHQLHSSYHEDRQLRDRSL